MLYRLQNHGRPWKTPVLGKRNGPVRTQWACAVVTLVGCAVNSLTDILFTASSGQGDKVKRIGYAGSFSNAALAALGTKCVTELAARPASLRTGTTLEI